MIDNQFFGVLWELKMLRGAICDKNGFSLSFQLSAIFGLPDFYISRKGDSVIFYT